MSLFDTLPRIISFRNNSYSAPIFDALPSLSSSFVRTFSLSTRSLSGILGDHGFLEQRNFYWTNMLGIDPVGAESSCVRGVVENVRTLAAASFFLGTALVSNSNVFGPAISTLLISLNSATSFLVDVASNTQQPQTSCQP